MSINPTVYEQYLLELINWARANPSDQASQLGIDLNENLPAGSISAGPKAPLVFNPLLIDAARDHSGWMLDNDIFSHTGIDGSSPFERVAATGYDAMRAGENIAWHGTTGQPDIEAYTLASHQGLFISSGHRLNLMNEHYTEIGLGALSGSFTGASTDYNSLMVTQKFAQGTSGPFLTGVVIDDGDGDGFYSIGEGLGNVTITAEGLAGRFQTTSWDAGGYNLALPSGHYTVTFSYQGQAMTKDVSIGASNVKLDAILTEDMPVQPLILCGARQDYAITLLPSGEGIIIETPDGQTETVIHVDRLEFDDGALVFDIDSANLGFSYRIYAAGYGRTPDEEGLRFWVDVMDQLEGQMNMDKRQDFLAREFLAAPEFIALYGESPSDFAYVDAMYENVLNRSPDQAGYEFWVSSMEQGLDRADILIYFAESGENVVQTAPHLADGIWLV